MSGATVAVSHSERRLTNPAGWVYCLGHAPPQRLVTFVHGFRGQAVATWQRFPASGSRNLWWQESDLLFVGYDSTKDSIKGIADVVREHLPRFYPQPPPELLRSDGVSVREAPGTYRELIVVGHSLGGVVVRRALVDAAHRWVTGLESDARTPRPPILDARVRLFSPASAGFRPGGWVGLMKATGAWRVAEPFLRRSTAYTDLQPGSELLTGTRARTEGYVRVDSQAFAALRAQILWARRDQIVIEERYDGDLPDDSVFATHTSVCKPDDRFPEPWNFVETGEKS